MVRRLPSRRGSPVTGAPNARAKHIACSTGPVPVALLSRVGAELDNLLA